MSNLPYLYRKLNNIRNNINNVKKKICPVRYWAYQFIEVGLILLF